MAGGYAPAAGYAAPRTDGLAIASLIIGILSICCVGIVLGPVAAIMGFIARQRVASSGGALGGGGLALAGLILGVVGFVLGAGLILLYIVGVISSSNLNFGSPTPS